uniref:Formin-binding protein 1-like isoform X4 n=3 Tax=Hirondellea gigas TaxID=1518452 RepID=A0A6A7FWD8_9CRUS
MRSWGEELWDQWDSVSVHSQKGIDFLDTYCRFVKERSTIEADYAKNLRKLVKSFSPKKKEDSEKFTVLVAFRDCIKETGDMAGQHELIAEDLNTQIAIRIHDLIKELKEERKKNLAEGVRLQQLLVASHQQLEKAKKNYEKSFRESEKAQDNFQRADADLNLSRAEVEKQRMNSSIKSQNCEDYKNEYANQLQKTNTIQNDHYRSAMPSVMRNFQELDMKRIKDIKNLIVKSTEIERSVYPILLKCLDGIVKAANSIDETADSEAVIEKYKSGFDPPADVPFDDLSCSKQNGGGGGSDSGGDSNSLPGHHNHTSTPTGHGYPAHRSDTVKGTLSANRFRKRANLFTGIFGSNKHNNSSFLDKEDFNELPPNQRKKKIQQKIDEVSSKLSQETAARDALLKMKEVYEGNPSLGDPLTITGQLNDSCSAIDKLKQDLDKYQTMLDHPDPPAPSPTPPTRNQHHNTSNNSSNLGSGGGLGVTYANTTNNNGHASSPRSSLASHRTSFSEESISRSSHSPESGISLSQNSLPGSEMSGANGTAVNHHMMHHHNNTTATPPVTSHLHNSTTTTTTTAAAPAIPLADADELDGDADDSNEFDADLLPVIGTCRALYGFDGVSEGSMALAEGEELAVIELDAGDGWTRVRKPLPDGGEEGFVPTSYIQVTLNSNC